jgi:tRNA U34 2-thiouridine synthase MnmA/TrmU
MIGKAREWIEQHGFDFIITGEVNGQRPKSQLRRFMPQVAEESGADDLLLRPLCAKNLPPTRPELEGWVDREQLKDFSGRSRKPQMALLWPLNLVSTIMPSQPVVAAFLPIKPTR